MKGKKKLQDTALNTKVVVNAFPGLAATVYFSRPATNAGLSSPASCFINNRGRAPVVWFSYGPVLAEELVVLPQADAEPPGLQADCKAQPPLSARNTSNHLKS